MGAGKPGGHRGLPERVPDGRPGRGRSRRYGLISATLWSHGATHLIAGEDGRLLVDPLLRACNLAAVPGLSTSSRAGRTSSSPITICSLDPAITDVTGRMPGLYNDDVDVTFRGFGSAGSPGGTVWRR